MEKIANIIQYPNHSRKNEMPNEQSLNKKATELVNQLFKILMAQITYFSFNNQNKEQLDFIKREWVKTFIANNMTEEKIKFGVDMLRMETKEIKTLTPTQFVSLCMKKTKPQHDTRPEWMLNPCLESDELKEKKKQTAHKHLGMMKDLLK